RVISVQAGQTPKLITVPRIFQQMRSTITRCRSVASQSGMASVAAPLRSLTALLTPLWSGQRLLRAARPLGKVHWSWQSPAETCAHYHSTENCLTPRQPALRDGRWLDLLTK